VEKRVIENEANFFQRIAGGFLFIQNCIGVEVEWLEECSA